MPEEGKKSGAFAQIAIAVVIAMCVGGTSPWWFKEIFPPKPDPVQPAHNDAGLVDTQNISQQDRSDLAKRQKQLEEELANLKREQQQNPQSRRQNKNQPNIGGTWTGEGSTYVITQSGNSLTLEEYTQPLGKTAAGTGRINGSDINFSIFWTAAGVTGTLHLSLSDGGDEMTGTFTDTYGNQASQTFSR